MAKKKRKKSKKRRPKARRPKPRRPHALPPAPPPPLQLPAPEDLPEEEEPTVLSPEEAEQMERQEEILDAEFESPAPGRFRRKTPPEGGPRPPGPPPGPRPGREEGESFQRADRPRGHLYKGAGSYYKRSGERRDPGARPPREEGAPPPRRPEEEEEDEPIPVAARPFLSPTKIPAAGVPFLQVWKRRAVRPERKEFAEVLREQREKERAAKEATRKKAEATRRAEDIRRRGAEPIRTRIRRPGEGQAQGRFRPGAERAERPGRFRRGVPPEAAVPEPQVETRDIDPAPWFPLEQLWNSVRQLRQMEGFAGGGLLVPISEGEKTLIDQAKDALAFFKIPAKYVEGLTEEEYWDFLRPFLESVEQSIKKRAPQDIPGVFQFANTPDTNVFGLLYVER